MPLTPQLTAPAIARQEAAASDPAAQVRLVAGPGSGKSFSIESRVKHLLGHNVSAKAILVLSFTRSSSRDLADRIRSHCAQAGLPTGANVHVGTFHSLALRVMRMAKLLDVYLVDPRVLDEWEMRKWIDAEFAEDVQVKPGRARLVREFHEAWWSTGQQNPTNYIPADPPISAQEQQQFNMFHQMQTGFYGCLLVGEIVKNCMQYAAPKAIDVRSILGVDHLIVDEYQDLNPMDLDFVDHLVNQGVITFVAGDDDQSVYSFRHASPSGIQTFTNRFPSASNHALSDCFRCAPEVLNAALNVLMHFASPERIPKQLTSLYAAASPPVPGHAKMTRFSSHQVEAEAIADSCVELNTAGLDWGDIMILLGNRHVVAAEIENKLTARGVPIASAQSKLFRDGKPGRAGFSMLRMLSDEDDLVAYKNLLSLAPQMGPSRCLDVTSRCVAANMSAVDLYKGDIPACVLQPLQVAKVKEVRAIAATIQAWDMMDTLAHRGVVLSQLIEQVVGTTYQQEWNGFCQALPQDTKLQELLDLLYADDLEKQHGVIAAVHARLGTSAPSALDPQRVQVKTMHGSKGLSAKVVFIPGLEENVFPTQRTQQKPGLVSEGARLLYVSITRARAAVFCSCACSRFQNGKRVTNPVSRYAVQLGQQVMYQAQPQGLTAAEAQQVVATCGQL